ncbi:PrgH/EprH family type III secretion apparatus protein [Yersinia ruckeri]|uniref:PrgH/EprH family type III secretion apparatus protein n=1 Tax=Yersinia ruckeri TaxID=29486 RepID=UPI001F1EA34A|nr:PrgH/EprH family type III secretion apparatus protein [Yersinia ruckeri]MCK8584336.1 hypothetical protein [Yersinia ruckeri]UIM98179.1 hypothetical protein LGL89_03345 [Yersinia ruckeri]
MTYPYATDIPKAIPETGSILMDNMSTELYIIKIAFGPMAGTELLVKPNFCQIVVAPGIKYETVTEEDSELTTYSLPTDEGEYKFTLHRQSDSEDLPGGLYAILEDSEKRHERIDIVFHTLLFADNFPILIKPVNDEWHYNSQVLPADKHNPTLIENLELSEKVRKNKLKPLPCLVIFILLIAGLFAFILASGDKDSQKIITLSELLAGSSAPLTILNSGENTSLILAKTQRDMDWVSQRLITESYSGQATTKLIHSFEKELEALVQTSTGSVLKVDLTTPCSPLVKLVRRINNQTEIETIKTTVRSKLKCANQIEIKSYDRKDILDEAINGIKSNNIPFKLINDSKKPVIIVNTDLNDKQFMSLIKFVTEFNQNWGDNYVQFSISLATDYLAGKSFLNSQSGYILLDNNHWYFKQ